MKLNQLFAVPLAACAMAVSVFAADATVTLSDVHLCCNSCVTGVTTALTPVAGVKNVADRDASTIVLTAADKPTLQKGVNALIQAGYFGKSNDSEIKVEAPSGASDAKVQTLDIQGVHLCCPKCVTAVKDILSHVDGVTANTVATRAPMFNVTGNFVPATIFQKLNAAGLAGHVATAAPVAAPMPGMK